MEFKIKKASEWDDAVKPVDEAYSKSYYRHFEHTLKAFDSMYDGAKEDYRKSKDFKIEDGKVSGDHWESDWMININNLDELMGFIGKYGELIIDGDSITIYDYFVE